VTRNSKESIATSIERQAELLVRAADDLPRSFKRAEHSFAKAVLLEVPKIRTGERSTTWAVEFRALVRERVQLVKLASGVIASIHK